MLVTCLNVFCFTTSSTILRTNLDCGASNARLFITALPPISLSLLVLSSLLLTVTISTSTPRLYNSDIAVYIILYIQYLIVVFIRD